MIKINEEVLNALKNKQGVVALESTIISHGMPYPENLLMAKKVERIIRENGCVPATIAIIEGVITIGLTEKELEIIASSQNTMKVSKRDIAFAVAANKNGATTVSATMLIAKMANIEMFATGGIGGVHRGAENTFDISRDLEELSETDITVVCAGAKSVLDLGLTMEYLETQGVEVIGYQTQKLPAFYTRESEFNVNYCLETPAEIARLIKTKRKLQLSGGILVTNPIPKEYSIDEKYIESIINDALKEAKDQKIVGKDITPFLLKRIKELTGGISLKANLELVYNNAMLAAQIAKELVK
ncbi:pseudouridine-5'-phosphate glycosidase [Acholeplasma sp. OttesenSCG-928-E16]|nr:pseudouridine-5'-phosphate glycosidase [Acholeplasma sp. OttesenSCG-928-E16]